MTLLRKSGIITQVHYIPVTSHPYYVDLKYNSEEYKNAMQFYKECLTLPLYFSLSNEEQDFVINELKMILEK